MSRSQNTGVRLCKNSKICKIMEFAQGIVYNIEKQEKRKKTYEICFGKQQKSNSNSSNVLR
jgi:hypothetical protein